MAVVYFAAPRPLLRFSYEYSAASFDPRANRHYHRCDYVGWSTRTTLRPRDGVCPPVLWKWMGDAP